MRRAPPKFGRFPAHLSVVLVLAAGLFSAAADEKGKLSVEKVAYKGWENNLRLSNGAAELIVTLDVGPRIISYRLADGKNVFKEYDAQLGKSGEKTWQIRGGHRLWAAPEQPERTYFPDNGPVKYAQLLGGEIAQVRFTPMPEKEHGLQKEIDIILPARGSKVAVVHRVKNIGTQPTELAIWALSVMAAGGVEVIPAPSKKPHPSSVPGSRPTALDFAPNQRLALWPFFDFKDPRFSFGSRYITLRQDAKHGPTKIGLAHKPGWVGYLNAGTLFVKRFPYEESKNYPDNGVNFETFTNEDMLEVETLGPLVKLEPGKSIEHTEHWELIKDVKDFKDEADIDKNILPKVTPK